MSVNMMAAKSLGQAKVPHLDLVFRRNLDVAGFQVPVYDIMLVCRGSRLSDLLSNG